LLEALRKMTLLPAQRLEIVAPSMRFKGRLQVGCDADITVFDAGSVIDKATYEDGLAFSQGIRYVMVNGVLVVKNAETVADVYPGQPVYGKYKK
ncbi:MAG: amidohydrolase family protein, partial [Saprospiraceae bacterium]|nr:amidohydrolase family protein [Saprospiraceae bacterium]